MNDSIELDQIDDSVLFDAVSDEALESAGNADRPLATGVPNHSMGVCHNTCCMIS